MCQEFNFGGDDDKDDDDGDDGVDDDYDYDKNEDDQYLLKEQLLFIHMS